VNHEPHLVNASSSTREPNLMVPPAPPGIPLPDLTRWVEQNDHYLDASLAWLRLRLLQSAMASDPEADADATGPSSGKRGGHADRASLGEAIAAAATARTRAAAMDP